MRAIRLGASLVAGMIGAALVVTLGAQIGWVVVNGVGQFTGASSASPAIAIRNLSTGGPLSIYPGTSTATAGVPASLFTSTTAASNVSTSETDLISYSLPANTLSANGQAVRITVWGTFAATANVKTVKVYFGATVVTTTSFGFNNAGWYAQSTVARTGATAQLGAGTISINPNALNVTTASPAETLSGAVTIKVTGQSAAASNDVTATAMKVEWVP